MTTKPGRFWFSLPNPYVSHEPRHGRENACSPVFICRHAPLWLILSATIERILQRSSTHPATFGNSSLTSMPDCPCRENLNGEPSRLPVFVRSSDGFANGSGFPVSAVRRGFGSN